MKPNPPVQNTIQVDGNSDASAMARGYYRTLTNPDTILFLHLMLDVTCCLAKLSQSLQQSNALVSDTHHYIKMASESFAKYQRFSTCDSKCELIDITQGEIIIFFFNFPQAWSKMQRSAAERKFECPISQSFEPARDKLQTNLTIALENRFNDLDSGVMQASQTVDFSMWLDKENSILSVSILN